MQAVKVAIFEQSTNSALVEATGLARCQTGGNWRDGLCAQNSVLIVSDAARLAPI